MAKRGAERGATEETMPPSLEELVGHSRAIFLLCFGFTRNRADAEDLAQETYLRACRQPQRLPGGDGAKAWLCRVARNLCLDHLRRHRSDNGRAKLATPPHAAEDPHENLVRREQGAALSHALERLPRRLRVVLVLREYGELSYEQIAQALEIELGTVMSRIHRARRKLAEAVRTSGEWR
jgi:RNA polymerase sigma-70 factor (ECF subfamily)